MVAMTRPPKLTHSTQDSTAPDSKAGKKGQQTDQNASPAIADRTHSAAAEGIGEVASNETGSKKMTVQSDPSLTVEGTANHPYGLPGDQADPNELPLDEPDVPEEFLDSIDEAQEADVSWSERDREGSAPDQLKGNDGDAANIEADEEVAAPSSVQHVDTGDKRDTLHRGLTR